MYAVFLYSIHIVQSNTMCYESKFALLLMDVTLPEQTSAIVVCICDRLCKTSYFCTFLKFHFIAFLLSRSREPKISALCDEWSWSYSAR